MNLESRILNYEKRPSDKGSFLLVGTAGDLATRSDKSELRSIGLPSSSPQNEVTSNGETNVSPTPFLFNSCCA